MIVPVIRNLSFLSIALLVSSCVSYTVPARHCPADTQQLENCPPLGAVDDGRTEALHSYRTWVKPSKLRVDPISMGKYAEIPIKSARAKILGPTHDDAVNSIAAKIWMIENAEHTIDIVYYIFSADLIGEAIMGALCDAVGRGVDVRFMVDAIGSFLLRASDIRALESCRVDAGFMHSATGELTIYQARVQTILFNSFSTLGTSFNRRSHDKLLVVDGYFPDKAAVITGGRNISLDYYGVNTDGTPNLYSYHDSEILLRTGPDYLQDKFSVGQISEMYYSLLALFAGNKQVNKSVLANPRPQYASRRQEFRDSLAKLKSIPAVEARLAKMSVYLTTGFADSNIRLAHEFGNLINTNVIRKAVDNLEVNPNSIMSLLNELGEHTGKHFRIVSPYIFLARYTGKNGVVVQDDAARILDWLAENPERRVEIITNSIFTSDNFGTQAVIDMDTAPRLLLPADLQEKWLKEPKATELDPEFMGSETWQSLVNHPQIDIYQTGRLDSELLGGDEVYAKLHAKFIVTDNFGFVGTANFDYRSRLYNNEMGFFFSGEELLANLNRDFEFLASKSYKWGSPEWLQMRTELREAGGKRSRALKKQRRTYRILRGTGMKWWF